MPKINDHLQIKKKLSYYNGSFSITHTTTKTQAISLCGEDGVYAIVVARYRQGCVVALKIDKNKGRTPHAANVVVGEKRRKGSTKRCAYYNVSRQDCQGL